MTPNEFIDKNYQEIMLMSQKICKSSRESEDVAHYCITEFLGREDVKALVNRGEGMRFLSGMIWRSFHSSTSPYHTVYRQKGRIFGTDDQSYYEQPESEYDFTQDLIITQIEKILEAMPKKGIQNWYMSTLFKMWLETENYSEISRQTGIPRTSISHAVEECRQYIREELKKSGINYE